MSNPLNLHATHYGDEQTQPLIILHGLFGSGTNWRSIARKLSEDYYVITLDLRNHGDSPWDDDMTYPAMAADVAYYINQQSIQNPILLGHSMGGKTAMTLTQQNLASISQLIIADIAPTRYQHSHEELLSAMQAVNLTDIQSRTEIEQQLAQSIDNNGLRQFLMQNIKRQDASYCWRINLEAIHNNLPALLDYQINQPSQIDTLFIAGENSSYITEQFRPTINHLFPNNRIDTIARAGHWLHAEQPSAFIQSVIRFVGK